MFGLASTPLFIVPGQIQYAWPQTKHNVRIIGHLFPRDIHRRLESCGESLQD